MITGLYIQEQFETAYKIIRANATSDDGEGIISFPPFDSLFDRETLIKECEPYIDLYERATRSLPEHKYLLMNNINFHLTVHINNKNEVTLLHLTFAPHADQHVAEVIAAALQGIVKVRVSNIS